ncbi:hypothetical protein E1176_09840 [Fulvivirga sp. RKSG066]|uniref:WG repeat-containing protein n=1 Tax=Fulvivirga aurantia TaxID=2529383 RepID=UPI0012BD0328|nr:WG repeat-containing protein [Fulvivirga aurantia]MTI21319.1 hypothetical protein [Fulvivirga aurantia]
MDIRRAKKSPMRLYLLLLLTGFLSSCVFGPVGTSKRALNQLEKGNFDKARTLTAKSLEKDSLVPALLFTKSKLLIAKNDPGLYDSGYYFILRGISVLDTLNLKDQEKHFKHGFDSTTLQSHKEKIDSLAFAYYEHEINTEDGYNRFLRNYPTASQVPDAIAKRDVLAFATAMSQNTYESYKAFMEKYPRAVQIPEAKRRYEKLYFDKSTADGRVASYIRFLDKHPQTPYRKEAEQKIFEVITAEHSVGGYRLFLRNYPKSHLRNKTIDLLYHVAKTRGESVNMPLGDSLQRVQALEPHTLFTFLEEGRFGFMDAKGEVVINPIYQTVNPIYKCSGITHDYLQVDNKVVGRNGGIISHQNFTEIEDLGYGLLKGQQVGGWSLFHKSGRKLRNTTYDEIRLINGNILALKRGQNWRLETISGRLLVQDNFDDIYLTEGYIIFEKGDLIEVKNVKQLMSAVDSQPISFDYFYSDYEILPNGNLWLESNYGEAVVDKNLEEVVSYGSQEIEFISGGYLVNKSGQYTFRNGSLEVLASHMKRVAYNQAWLAGRVDSSTAIIRLADFAIKNYEIDSVKLIGAHFLTAYKNDSVKLFFPNGVERGFKKSVSFDLLNGGEQEYIFVIDDKRLLYNTKAQYILEVERKEFSPLGKEYLVFTVRGKKGLIDAKTGKVLLKAEFDAIGNYDNGRVSLLKKRKFGMFDITSEGYVKPEYDKNISQYSDSVYVGEKGDKAFILDKQGDLLIDEGFEMVEHWSDTVALVKKEGDWHFLSLNSAEISDLSFQSYDITKISEEEKVITILSNGKYGVVSNLRGEVVPPTFNDIVLFNAPGQPVFFTEKRIKEAAFYVVIYYDIEGNVLRKQAFESAAYDKIYCD